MKKAFIYWFVILIIAGIISIFIHEVGHGISAYLRGYPVSTGFNKVGDYNKRPSEDNFREEHKKYKNPWDMGPFLTLLLAVIFTYMLAWVDNKLLVYLTGSFAFVNALLRLIPMIGSYFSFIINGSLSIEDEIAMGTLWYQMSDIFLLKFIPSIISILVSVICLKYIFKSLSEKLPQLFTYRWPFTIISIGAFLVLMKIIQFLDEHVRINWG